jgi:hypothetical protein
MLCCKASQIPEIPSPSSPYITTTLLAVPVLQNVTGYSSRLPRAKFASVAGLYTMHEKARFMIYTESKKDVFLSLLLWKNEDVCERFD